MDTITQGILGAVAAQCISDKKDIRTATWVGFLAGGAADLDVLIFSPHDPLLSIELHRHFTHALGFIPIGGFICALVFWLMTRMRHPFSKMFKFSLIAYATHGLLDACTTYGTQLLWPFSNARIAWDVIAIIDPVFSGVLFILMVLAFFKHKEQLARIGFIFILVYFSFAVVQRERALNVVAQLAKDRGHAVERITAKPTLFNLVLWRGIYESKGTFHVDGVRVGLFSSTRIYPGSSVKRFYPETALPDGGKGTVLFRDMLRFAWFADHYTAIHPDNPAVIGDLRYAMLPGSTRPLWGIEIDHANPERHVPFRYFRKGDKIIMDEFIRMVLGEFTPKSPGFS